MFDLVIWGGMRGNEGGDEDWGGWGWGWFLFREIVSDVLAFLLYFFGSHHVMYLL